MPWPTPLEVWQRLSPRQRSVLGWLLIPIAALAVTLYLAERHLPTIAEMSEIWHAPDVVEISAFEATQLQEDKRHAGEECVDWDDSEDGIACRFDDGCILAKHVVGGVISRVYDIHPERFGAPPPDEHNHDAAAVSSAGFGVVEAGGGGRCVEPPQDHPGEWYPETQEPTSDRCWVYRFGRFFAPNGYTDGCVLRVAFNICGNFYDWRTAQWVSCYH